MTFWSEHYQMSLNCCFLRGSKWLMEHCDDKRKRYRAWARTGTAGVTWANTWDANSLELGFGLFQKDGWRGLWSGRRGEKVTDEPGRVKRCTTSSVTGSVRIQHAEAAFSRRSGFSRRRWWGGAIVWRIDCVKISSVVSHAMSLYPK